MEAHRALVTGGAGFIGSHVVERLLDRGVEVVVLDDLSTGRRENVPEGVEIVQGDVRNLDLVEDLVGAADVVFHQAARVSIRSSMAAFHEDAMINLAGTLNVLEAMVRTGRARKLVYASSMAVYSEAVELPISEDHPQEPLSPYGIAKLASEKYCLQVAAQSDFQAVCLRYFNTFGARQTYTPYVGVITIFINQALQGEAPRIFGDGEQTRDFVYVGDVADANMLAMERDVGSGVYNIGSGRGTSVNAVARLVLDRLAPELEAVRVASQPGELRDSVADLSRAARDLGYGPSSSLEDKIDEVVAWWRGTR